ncbi:GGDEF domain-containing protein [Imhoffiella purpurea]|uniref:diguanylate cyclase n=1 Tax=Imhoffiella purpurea TaxID=1249627 RepID=W9VMC3_9GAMM|nr:GGDEF domain-containing protein [Imhoffiella purpurea]EXJ17257.1 hypothetical protein D779_0084 [Imhoffiella purpurea]
MSDAQDKEQDLLWALNRYVMGSGRLLVVELDPTGRIRDCNVAFRSRFAGFNQLSGEPMTKLFAGSMGDSLDLEPGIPRRTGISHVLIDRRSDETFLFQTYRVGDGSLLIGEPADSEESDVVERMGHLAIEMSRLVRDLRKTNQDLRAVNARAEKLARTDPLTGIANRRYFMERLRLSIEHSQSRGHALSLLMIDLDHFKDINDRFGHVGGDSALIAVASLLVSQLRAVDLSGRFGGEEFILFMQDAALPEATKVAERLRERIGTLRPCTEEVRISASIGVTELAPDDDPESLIKRADTLLYRAKTGGRDRVVSSSKEAMETGLRNTD